MNDLLEFYTRHFSVSPTFDGGAYLLSVVALSSPPSTEGSCQLRLGWSSDAPGIEPGLPDCASGGTQCQRDELVSNRVRIILLLEAGPVLCTFMQYSATFSSQPEAASNAISGVFVRLIVSDNIRGLSWTAKCFLLHATRAAVEKVWGDKIPCSIRWLGNCPVGGGGCGGGSKGPLIKIV